MLKNEQIVISEKSHIPCNCFLHIYHSKIEIKLSINTAMFQ